jgi:small GTP-binding protein
MASDSKVIVLVGDASCGKSSLASMFTANIFSTNHYETVFEDYHAELEGPGGLVELKIYDTSGDEHGEGYELRKMIYPEADAILICFDLTSPFSIDNVEKKWVPEVNKHCPNKPFFLVGCKKDLLRTLRKFSVDYTACDELPTTASVDEDSSGYDTDEDCFHEEKRGFNESTHRMNSLHVNHADLWSLLLRCSAANYFECSARTSESVVSIFSKVLGHLECAQKKSKSNTWPRNKSPDYTAIAQMYESERRKSTSYLSSIKKCFKKNIKKLRRSKSGPVASSR